MAERVTNFEVLYELLDVTSQEDSTLQTFNIKNFCDPTLLKQPSHSYKEQATLEKNMFVLDGTLEEFDNTPSNIAFFSSGVSNNVGEYDSQSPSIDISFSEVHSSYGITIGFSNSYVYEMYITWMYNSVTLVSKKIKTSGKICWVNQPVDNYNHIIIQFPKVTPGHYVKIDYVYFGAKFLWGEEIIKKATLVRDVDVNSEKIPIDTLNFELIDNESHELNIANTRGMFKYFQKNQPLYAYEYVNGNKLPLGKFYFSKYTHKGNVGKLNCVSLIGVIDGIQYEEGEVYNGKKAGLILESIFSVCGITNYTIDNRTYNTPVYGTITPQSCRNAIRQVLFACHSIIDTTDAEQVVVRKLSASIRRTVSRSFKFSTSVESIEYVSGVKLNFKKYFSGETKNLIDNVLYSQGTHRVIFSSPVDPSTIYFSSLAGITNVVKKTYYVEFTCSQDVQISINGNEYITQDCSVITNREKIDAGEFENIKQFTLELCDYDSVGHISEELLKYYEKNFKISIRYLCRELDMTDMYERRIVENSFADMDNYVGNYTTRSFDLTGGFIETSKLVGTYVTQDREYFTDDELIADDDIII